MKYFAYGSNMNPQRMKDRGVSYSTRLTANLKGYTLKFNKTAARNPKEGYANIVPDKKQVVEGALYEITDDDILKLDSYEGYPDNYYREKVTVLLTTGIEEAVTYIASQDKVQEGLKPSKEYLKHLLAAWDMLSDEYYQHLKLWETID